MTDVGLAGAETGFREASGEPQVQAVPLAHLSIEVGHFYRDDLLAGPDRLRHRFQQVAAWVEAARGIAVAGLPAARPRISTSFLLDDYSAELAAPGELLPALIQAARDAGVDIDYVAREAACVEADGVPLARLVEERVVADPPPGTNGSRPPVTESGWLSNGQRTPAITAAAMESKVSWQPPVENAANRHSVFVDVELWDEQAGTRTWSCAHLAAVWQLLRLGLLRWRGARVAIPKPWSEPLPPEWGQVPAVIQLNPRAAPFSAYRTISVLSGGFLATEHAVRTILSQVSIDPVVQAQVADRAAAEGLVLPQEPVDRISYVFTD